MINSHIISLSLILSVIWFHDKTTGATDMIGAELDGADIIISRVVLSLLEYITGAELVDDDDAIISRVVLNLLE